MTSKLTRNDILNWWLSKYHNTTVDEIVKNYDSEFISSTEWFKQFPVTQSQYNEWLEWLTTSLSKELRMSLKKTKKMISLSFIELDCGPFVKSENS